MITIELKKSTELVNRGFIIGAGNKFWLTPVGKLR